MGCSSKKCGYEREGKKEAATSEEGAGGHWKDWAEIEKGHDNRKEGNR